VWWGRARRRALAVVAVAALAGTTAGCSGGNDRASADTRVHIATVPRTETTGDGTVVIPTAPPPAPPSGPPVSRRPRSLIDPSGRAPGGALVFRSSVPIPADLVFVAVLGGDARTHEDVRRSHADSIHIIAVNPRTHRGTIVGIARDTWVEIPGHGNDKINAALAEGGPTLAVETLRHLTGLPIDHYFLTGFAGLPRMVDELGGIDVYVDRTMDDDPSGAHFKPGWHHMNGEMVLAYSRDRKDVPGGDFGRSENHGKVLLAALAKLRAEVSDDAGLGRWLDVLRRHAVLETPLATLQALAALARGLDPVGMTNAVVPGRVGTAGRASVVYLDSRAAAMFEDLRDDASLGKPPPPVTASSSSSSSSSSSTSSTRPSTRPSTSSTAPATTTTTGGHTVITIG
jgi:polyisoprenyl-teichoic acid--peptidoglycan teichoic acid transferase